MKTVIKILFLSLLLSTQGCTTIIATSAAVRLQNHLNVEYGKYLVNMQESGDKSKLLSFDEWIKSQNEDFGAYGSYYNTCITNLDINPYPFTYLEWKRSSPRPVCIIPSKRGADGSY
jgi:hypothetical protein